MNVVTSSRGARRGIPVPRRRGLVRRRPDDVAPGDQRSRGDDRRLPAAAGEADRQRPDRARGDVVQAEGEDGAHLRRLLVHVDDRLGRGRRHDDPARHQGHESALARVEGGRRGALHEGRGGGRRALDPERLDRAALGEPGERGARAEEPRRAEERPAEDRLRERAGRPAPLRRGPGVERRREELVRARDQHALPGGARQALEGLLPEQRQPLVLGEGAARALGAHHQPARRPRPDASRSPTRTTRCRASRRWSWSRPSRPSSW